LLWRITQWRACPPLEGCAPSQLSFDPNRLEFTLGVPACPPLEGRLTGIMFSPKYPNTLHHEEHEGNEGRFFKLKMPMSSGGVFTHVIRRHISVISGSVH